MGVLFSHASDVLLTLDPKQLNGASAASLIRRSVAYAKILIQRLKKRQSGPD